MILQKNILDEHPSRTIPISINSTTEYNTKIATEARDYLKIYIYSEEEVYDNPILAKEFTRTENQIKYGIEESQ